MNYFEIKERKNLTPDINYIAKRDLTVNPFTHSSLQRWFAGNRFYILTAFILFILLDAGGWLLAFIP